MKGISIGLGLAAALLAFGGASVAKSPPGKAKTYPVVARIPAGDSFWDYAAYRACRSIGSISRARTA